VNPLVGDFQLRRHVRQDRRPEWASVEFKGSWGTLTPDLTQLDVPTSDDFMRSPFNPLVLVDFYVFALTSPPGALLILHRDDIPGAWYEPATSVTMTKETSDFFQRRLVRVQGAKLPLNRVPHLLAPVSVEFTSAFEAVFDRYSALRRSRSPRCRVLCVDRRKPRSRVRMCEPRTVPLPCIWPGSPEVEAALPGP
jgi:hypothetical protein